MSYQFYKFLHLYSIIFLVFSLGAASIYFHFGIDAQKPSYKKWIAIIHGVSLTLILVAGFGMLARLGLISGWPLWVWIKIVVWLGFGGLMAIFKRKKMPLSNAAGAIGLLAFIAAYFGIFHT